MKMQDIINCFYKFQMQDIINSIKEFRNKTGRNIAICGPRMGEEIIENRSNLLRVYSYGGLVAEFGISKSDNLCIKFLDKEYAKEDVYISGKGQIFLSKILDTAKSERRKKYVLTKTHYWQYASEAAENKYTTVIKETGARIPKERNIESHIIERYINRRLSPFSIFDMEFFSPVSWKEKYNISGKPDLICFDEKNGFGLLELKYNNQACDGKSGLKKHFTDLNAVIKGPGLSALVTELKRRVKICQEYRIMNSAICSKILNMDDNQPAFWMGFLFVNDDGSDPRPKIRAANIQEPAKIMCVRNLKDIAKWVWKHPSEL